MPTDYQDSMSGRPAGADAETTLMSFGFTENEAKLYCELLRSGPASGYRLAQRIGKAPANIYQALKSLQQKGAAIASEGLGEATIYSPTPPDELLAALRHAFEARQLAARASLESIRKPAKDERVYAIPTVAFVFERTRKMLAQAEKIVLIDFFPAIYAMFRDEIDACRARGVIVAGIAYEKGHIDPTMPYNSEAAKHIQSRWAGHGLMIVVDGRQMLLGQIDAGMSLVLNAIWTDNAFLSCIFHSGIASGIRLVALRTDDSDPMQILSLQQSRPPGLEQLQKETLQKGMMSTR